VLMNCLPGTQPMRRRSSAQSTPEDNPVTTALTYPSEDPRCSSSLHSPAHELAIVATSACRCSSRLLGQSRDRHRNRR